jgi:hypothetical protein
MKGRWFAWARVWCAKAACSGALFAGVVTDAHAQIGHVIQQQVMRRPRPRPVKPPPPPPSLGNVTPEPEREPTPEERRERFEQELTNQYNFAKESSAKLIAALAKGPPAPDPGAKPKAWTWVEASAVAADFGAAVKQMEAEAEKFHGALAVDATPPEFVGSPSQRAHQQIAFARECRNRARLMFLYHTRLHEAAYRASRFRPSAIEVYEWLADYYRAKADQAEFKETELDFAAQAQMYQRNADLLRATPVVLPAGYNEIGRLLQENVWFLEESMKGLAIHAELAVGTGQELGRYTEAFVAYRAQFNAWRTETIPRLSGAANPRPIP